MLKSLWEQRWWGRGIYCLSYDKSAVILAYLEPSEFSSHMASAFRCSALNSSALRSSARDIARPRKAGRHSGPEPRSPLRPAGRKGCTELMSKNYSKIFSPVLCNVLRNHVSICMFNKSQVSVQFCIMSTFIFVLSIYLSTFF